MVSRKGKSKLEKELEEALNTDPAHYRKFHFSHNSAEEFLRFKGESPENYRPIHLSVVYVNAKDDERICQTELKLAQKAIDKGCRYVTNIDYCGPCIAGTGLKPV